ncbi:conserved Plasmodium protein, unknown function [Plasmodium sp. DRC-Itaito]|nr:conserved Plasmodium protein, unknown function [Plasmodium sp. DRC-Itaito]
MLDTIRKYIYFEILLLLFFLNYKINISIYVNIAVVTYLTALAVIYLIFKFRYGNYRIRGPINYNLKGKHVCIIGSIIKEKPKTITLMSRNVDKLKDAKKLILSEMKKEKPNLNIKINIIRCDLSVKASIKEAFDNVLINNSLDKEEDEENYNIAYRTRSRMQKMERGDVDICDINDIDVLICNAAYVSTEENNKLQMYDLIYTINTNIYGNIDIISKAIIHMKRKKTGLILFINTEGALYPIYGYSFYLMSKSSMWVYTHILDQELKYYNIHIANAFLPSVETPGFIQENLKKPEVTRKIEQLTNTINSDYAADKIINKLKQGRKFITLRFNGYMLSILHSGYRNPESYFDYLIYVSFSNLFIFISSLYKLYIEYIIKKKFHSILYN